MVTVCTMAFTIEFSCPQSLSVSRCLLKAFKTCGPLVKRVTFMLNLVWELKTMFVTLLMTRSVQFFQKVGFIKLCGQKPVVGCNLSQRMMSSLKYLRLMLFKRGKFSRIKRVELEFMIGLPLKEGLQRGLDG